MSLEELLAEEGFNRGRPKMIPRKSFGSETRSMQLYQDHHKYKPGSSSAVRKTLRTKSDMPHYVRGEFPTNDKVKGRKPKDNLVRLDAESIKETGQKNERRSSQDLRHVKKSSFGSYEDLESSRGVETVDIDEIVEVEVNVNGRYGEIYSNEVYSDEESETKRDSRYGRQGSFIPLSEKKMEMVKTYGYSSNKNLTLYKSFNKSKKQPEIFSRSSQNGKSLHESKSCKKADIEQNAAIPALDEAAIRAIISMLSGYFKYFLRDEDFRASLRRGSFSSLNISGVEEGFSTESKVVANIEEAIETAERAAEERSNAKELKKASLQLSVIAGLNTNDLKDGYTSGIPNYKLSACAHLYLGVIYKLQKKDKAAAKHLLQVFCDSPFQARTVLLPDLWDQIFLPHLLHVKSWYDKEVESLANSKSKKRKLKLLDTVYDEILDSGTYQFAAYYKDWLTEGAEAPLLPSIQIPSISVQLIPQEDLSNESIDGFPSQPVVSKQLYDSVFRHLIRPGTELVECEEESFDISARSSYCAALEENSSTEIIKRTVQDVNLDETSHLDTVSGVKEVESSFLGGSPEKACQNENFGNCQVRQGTPESLCVFYGEPIENANEMILKRLAKIVFELQQPEKAINHTAVHSSRGSNVLLSESMLTELKSPCKVLQGSCENFDRGDFFSSVPQEFICPLTGLVLDDPVTLETGQTFEKSAITNWFSKGNRTCPVTRKTLECQSIPLSNFILKRVISKWKLEYHRCLIDLTHKAGENVETRDEIAVFILEQLLVVSTQEERVKNARELMSLGGLEFLISRFQCGDIKEKTCISALLFNCVLVDADWRKHVSMKIDKLSLLKMLQSEHLNSRANAVSLLTELICVNRRKEAKYFLEALQKEEIVSALDSLMNHLQCCREEYRPRVALLLLHFDLLVEPQKYSVYREEAVDAITMALESSLHHESVREQCFRVLLISGGNFSSAGKIMTEDWVLKQAGFLHGPVFDSPGVEEAYELVDENTTRAEDVDEEEAREKWLANLSVSLLGEGSKSFLEVVSRCLVSGIPDLVRVCLTTVAWLSSALVSLSHAELQLSAFSSLISGLKVCLEHGELVEHRILASMSLFNLGKFPECRLLLMTMAEDIAGSLESLEEVTWTAKELHAMICT